VALFAHYDATNQREWIILAGTPPNLWSVQTYKTGATAGGRKSYISSLVNSNIRMNLLAFTHNAGVLSLYRNGVLDTNPTKTGDTAVETIHNSTANILVSGSYTTGSLALPSKQIVGEALIFNRALSTQEHRDFFEMTRHRYGV